MQIIVAFLFIVAIISIISPFPRERRDYLPLRAQTIATQMAWYHNQAVSQCSPPNSACPVGIIPVNVLYLPPNSTIYNNFYQSASNGMTIVTTWIPGNIPMANDSLSGQVASALRLQSNGSLFAGAYNAVSQTIGIGSVFAYQGNYTSSPTILIPLNFGGLSLINGQPVLATPVS